MSDLMKNNSEVSDIKNRNDSWRGNINYNTVTAVFFLILWTVMFFIIPYQIQKPMLFMGRSLMGLKPTLFPRLATLALIGLSIWYLLISFRIKEKNLFKDVTRYGYFRITKLHDPFYA